MRWAASAVVLCFVGDTYAAQPLFEAIRKDDVNAVEAMLKAGTDAIPETTWVPRR